MWLEVEGEMDGSLFRRERLGRGAYMLLVRLLNFCMKGREIVYDIQT